MDAKQRRRYEMLLRLRDFGMTHRELFATSPLAQEAFESLNSAVDELTATDLVKLSASASARANRQAVARKTLTELLLKVTQLARVLRARGKDLPRFDLPESRSDQMLLTAARQFAQDAAAFDADFAGHGLGPKAIADATFAFDTALRDRGMKRADHTAARTRIQDLLSAVVLDVRRLDLIVESQLANNTPLLAVWREARRVLSARTGRSTGAGTSETPSPEPAVPVEPSIPASAGDQPAPATVIEMPQRRAA
jgi:hypothetical protein